MPQDQKSLISGDNEGGFVFTLADVFDGLRIDGESMMEDLDTDFDGLMKDMEGYL